MDNLVTAYRDVGGAAYIGDEAWNHLEEEAGDTMACFIERYVRKPIMDVSAFEICGTGGNGQKQVSLLDLVAKRRNNEILLSLGRYERRIVHGEDFSLAEDESDES